MTNRDMVPRNPKKRDGDKKGWPFDSPSLLNPDAVVIDTRPKRQKPCPTKSRWPIKFRFA